MIHRCHGALKGAVEVVLSILVTPLPLRMDSICSIELLRSNNNTFQISATITSLLCHYREKGEKMRKGQVHPSATLSKQLLAEALIQLLQQVEYPKVTITSVCKQAQIARRTFYRNFKTLEDILVYYISTVMEDFIMELQQHMHTDYRSIVLTYFTFWEKHVWLLNLLHNNQLIHIIFTQYIKCLHEFPTILSSSNTAELHKHDVLVQLAYTSGGLWSVLTFWVSSGCRHSPEELTSIVCTT